MNTDDSQLLCVKNLTRRDHATGRPLLDQINLTVVGGERIGLVGVSGSGKSSLLRSIAKLDACDEGVILFRGTSVTGDAIPGFRRRVIYLPQRPALFPGTFRENLQIAFQVAVSREHYDESTVGAMLNELNKPISILDQSADSLSGGEQQLLALIRAILLRPTVLLLDEPTASLDGVTTKRLEQLVLAWQSAEENTLRQHRHDQPNWMTRRSFIWASHDLEQIHRMTTRVVQIEHGVLTMETVA